MDGGGSRVKPSSLLLTPEKSVPDSLRETWNLAAGILSRSDRLLVFGFAFNPYDAALLEHLAPSRGWPSPRCRH